VKILAALSCFWLFNAAHWCGVFSLGIVDTRALGWYSVACFIFTVAFLFGLLLSGSRANKLKRWSEFLSALISEKEAEEKERETRILQEALH